MDNDRLLAALMVLVGLSFIFIGVPTVLAETTAAGIFVALLYLFGGMFLCVTGADELTSIEILK